MMTDFGMDTREVPSGEVVGLSSIFPKVSLATKRLAPALLLAALISCGDGEGSAGGGDGGGGGGPTGPSDNVNSTCSGTPAFNEPRDEAMPDSRWTHQEGINEGNSWMIDSVGEQSGSANIPGEPPRVRGRARWLTSASMTGASCVR